MIDTLCSYSTSAKTAEIMSKYRPIAPKPEPHAISIENGPSELEKIRQSAYLRDVWPVLQSRPTRTRKRGKAAISAVACKRTRTHQIDDHCGESRLVTLPLLPLLTAEQSEIIQPVLELIDLNVLAEIPEEKDLLQQLQQTPIVSVISPRPIRPVGSNISVGCISEGPSSTPVAQIPKTPEQVEKDVESELLPAVISDSNNKVRLANSAYKEMVGQPECSWLDSMVPSDGSPQLCSSPCGRICGEVVLHFSDAKVPVTSNKFSCWVRIEWEGDGKKKTLEAFCDVIRLYCASKDYHFTWRFHTQ